MQEKFDTVQNDKTIHRKRKFLQNKNLVGEEQISNKFVLP
jgi:hypothetical protein